MSVRSRIMAILLGAAFLMLLSLAEKQATGWQGNSDESAVLAQEPDSAEATIANCRYGVTPLSSQQVPIVSDIGAGWYLDFGPRPPEVEPANDAQFFHLVGVFQDKIDKNPANPCNCPDDYQYLDSYNTNPPLDANFANYLKNNPGETHIVGNEIERFGQGGIFSSVFIDAYHDIYYFIKGHDPTARVAMSALVQFTPNREQYLSQVWNRYLRKYGSELPVDIWTMHVYVLPELGMVDGQWVPNNIASVGLGTNESLGRRESLGDPGVCGDPNVICVLEHDDIANFEEQVVRMRQWMKDRGEQDKPLVMTEYSILYPYLTDSGGACEFLRDENGKCFTPQRVTTFMNKSLDYLKNAKDPNLGYPLDDNRLVQQWMWFSVYNHESFVGQSSNLVTDASASTYSMMGQNFKNRVAAESLYKNLKFAKADDVEVAANGTATATAYITAEFTNIGNEAVNQPFTVTFYRNAAHTNVIGSVTIDPTIRGCGSHLYEATIPWSGLTKGTYKYYVKVDSANVIPESTDGDNSGSGTVRVFTNDIKLPIVRSNVQ